MLFGGAGIDTFVIKAGDGVSSLADCSAAAVSYSADNSNSKTYNGIVLCNTADVILDFADGTDIIGMSGLQYSDLTVEQGAGNYSNHVVITKTDTGEVLAVIMETSINSISDADFSAI